MPAFVAPMLATLVDTPFNDPEWLFEIKWDGYRCLAFIKKGRVELKSRSDQNWSDKFLSVQKALEKIKGDVILDGEIVVLDKKGKSHFQLMQNYQRSDKGTLCYYVFDILYHDGEDLRQLPLIERKEILKSLLEKLNAPQIRFSDHIIGKGEAFFKAASKKELEGIIAKNSMSVYQSKRSQDWLKIKTHLRQEVVIGGFTAPRGSRKRFGALLVGVYNEANELIYSGHTGGGFTGELLEEVYQKLKPIVQKKCPFKDQPSPNAPVTWVKPVLVCEVSFMEWTSNKMMRQPIFQGLRMDKKPKTIKQEIPKRISKKPKEELTSLDKIYWPKEGYTKGDLLDYYKKIGKYMLPYLKNRPITLHRYPNGIEGTHFYQKDLETHPEWIKTIPVEHEGGKIVHYLLIDNLRSLLYAVNLGSIDLHPFMANNKDLDKPDYCVIDLDPHDVPFQKTIEVAMALHEMLDEWKVKHYCKTSGGKGLHFVIPLKGKYDFTQSRQFAEIIGYHLHQRVPKTTSLERDPKKRPKKIYIDCLQNRIGQTIVAPYSVRPRPKAFVSTPIEWNELPNLDISKFTMESIPERLKKKGDIFKSILGAGVDIKKILKRLENS